MLRFRSINILLAIVFLLTILPALPVCVETSKDIEDIRQVLYQSLIFKYEGYVADNPEKAKKALKSLHASEESFNDEANEIDRERNAASKAHLKYLKHSTKLEIKDAKIRERLSSVEAKETTIFDISTLGGPTDTAFVRNHMYELKKIENKWVISKDTIIDGIRPREPAPDAKPIPASAKTMELNPEDEKKIKNIKTRDID